MKKISTTIKYMLIKYMLISMLTLMMYNSVKAQITKQDPSSNPPNGLATNKVPQFISFGFDDNGFADGMYWIVNYLKNLKNPVGGGQAATYDGMPARMSFYNTTNYIQESTASDNPDSVKLAWNYAYINGFEIGNHTHTHADDLVTADGVRWTSEMQTCNDSLAAPIPPVPSGWTATQGTGAGVTKSDIHGFRTPFLAYGGPVFPALKTLGFEYDCSIEEGDQATQDGSNFFWPYTLDNANLSGHYASWKGNTNNPDHFDIPNVPGLWEVADQVWMLPDDVTCQANGWPTGIRTKIKSAAGYSWVVDKLTGFDYNAWYATGLNKAEFLAVLKYNFNIRYNGNRAPWVIGGHSDIYSLTNNVICSGATVQERREAIQEFIQYVLSKSDARIVTTHQILQWCKYPVALKAGSGPFNLNITATNGSVTKNPDKTQYNNGDQVIITANPSNGFQFTGWSGAITGTTNPITITMDNNKDIVANFTKIITCTDFDDFLADATIVSTKDVIGSTIDPVTITNSQFSINYSMPAQSGNVWPWVEVECTPAGKFTGLCSVKITYKSNYKMRVTLNNPTLAGGTSHMYELPVSADNWKTVTIQKTSFAQPSWVSPTTPLDLTKVNILMLVPIEYGVTGNIQINELKIYGLMGNSVGIENILNTNEISIYSMNAQNLNVFSPEENNYLLNIYTIDGRIICQKNIHLNKGNNVIELNSTLAIGTYIVRLTGSNNVTVKKISLIK